MRLNALLSDIVVQLDPSYSTFLDDNGCLVVELDKALYGLKESALLWYQLLCDKLCSIGFTRNRGIVDFDVDVTCGFCYNSK